MDYSNNNINDASLHRPLFTFLDEYVKRLQENKPTPKLAFLIPTNELQINALWNQVYAKYPRELFFMYEGKPLLMPMDGCNFAICNQFTSRATWGLQAGTSCSSLIFLHFFYIILLPIVIPPFVANDIRWSFMDLYPQPQRGMAGEQMAVSAAQQADYMSNLNLARGRNWSPISQRNNASPGSNLKFQFLRAIQTPKVRVVLIKAWNEWASQNLEGNFTDEFNEEYSNDIEPMSGGHGDFYYQLTKSYVNVFKQGVQFDCNRYVMFLSLIHI